MQELKGGNQARIMMMKLLSELKYFKAGLSQHIGHTEPKCIGLLLSLTHDDNY